jgi:4-hydroxybenzoate polyprenyltransferase
MCAFYLGGAFLNDAFDADYDRQRRISRPIPAAAIEAGEVWGWGLGWLALGWLILWFFGGWTPWIGAALGCVIVLHNAIHRVVALSPLLLGLCRLLVYAGGASASSRGLSGAAVWGGLAMACYVSGLGFMALKAASRSSIGPWPLALLAAPLGLAWFVNDGFRDLAGLVALYMAGWIVWTLWRMQRNVGGAASHLLSGAALADLLAVASLPDPAAWLVAIWFPAALYLQRRLPPA